MRSRVMSWTILALAAVSTGAWAQTGTTYRFRSDTLVGKVWVLGDNARRELESGEGGLAAGRVEIWKDGGQQVFILNPADRTYYEGRAYFARHGGPEVSLEPLTARLPFRVDGVGDLHVDLKVLPRPDVVSGYSCQRAVLTLSYSLRLGIDKTDVSMPGRVEGSEEFCLMDAPKAPPLPFGHRLELTSGHPQVDAAVAERLASLKGIPLARILKVTRRIEKGDPVSATSVLVLSDVQEAAIALDRFEVPKDYRFQEPVLVAPVRKHH